MKKEDWDFMERNAIYKDKYTRSHTPCLDTSKGSKVLASGTWGGRNRKGFGLTAVCGFIPWAFGQMVTGLGIKQLSSTLTTVGGSLDKPWCPL
jgi:hypothetical protein